MTEPLTFIRYELDEQTRDELAPPCEGESKTTGPCKQPAEWAVTVRCSNCGARLVLDCTYHKEAVAIRDADCRICYSRGDLSKLVIVSAVRL